MSLANSRRPGGPEGEQEGTYLVIGTLETIPLNAKRVASTAEPKAESSMALKMEESCRVGNGRD